MKNGIKDFRFITCLLCLGLLFTGTGCSDSDFDLSNLDTTIGIGGDALVLPTSDTEEIQLDDVLELNNSDVVSIKANGDYYFSKEGDDVSPANPEIKVINLVKQSSSSDNLYLDFASPAPAKGGVRKVSMSKTVEGIVSTIAFKGDVPEAVKELVSAEVMQKINIRITSSSGLKQLVSQFSSLELVFPEFMQLKGETLSNGAVVSGNTVKISNVSSANEIDIVAELERIDFTATSTIGNSLLKNEGGVLDFKAQILARVAVDEINAGVSGVSDSYIACEMDMDDMVLEKVTGRFDPSVELNDLGSFTISSIPDFLNDNDVKINLYNPLVTLSFDSDMDIAGLVSGVICAEDESGKVIARVNVPEMTIKPNQKTTVLICKYASEVNAGDYDEVKEVKNLSDLLYTIPKRVYFEAEARADADRVSSFVLGKRYTIMPKYSVEAPLAFDEGASIVYNDTIDGLYGDLDEYSLMDGAYVEMNAEVVNKVPLALDVTANAIDVDGNAISSDLISVEVETSVSPSKDGVEAAVSPLKVVIKEKKKGTLKTVDGIALRAEAASGEGQQSIVGKTINAYNQTLVVRNIKVKLVGRVIADLN